MVDRMTFKFLDPELPSRTIGEVLEDYRRTPDRPWMVEHLWYLIGTGELTISSTVYEAKRVVKERRCQRIRQVRQVHG